MQQILTMLSANSRCSVKICILIMAKGICLYLVGDDLTSRINTVIIKFLIGRLRFYIWEQSMQGVEA